MKLTLEQQHADMVAALIKDGQSILSTMTGREAELMHAVFGISGEAGELLDAIKKHIIYKKPLDTTNVIEELGDLEFYMCNIRTILNIDREDCLKSNMEKLALRYPNYKYTDSRAVERRDKE